MQDIRSTGEAAERWLEALESDQLPSPNNAEHEVRVSDSYVRQGTISAQDQAHPALILLILATLITPLILLAVYQGSGRRSSSSASNTSLSYTASCGSITSSSGRWWPVLGGADSSLLATVRGRYCGDAYINAQGSLQVASFGTWQEADAFREQIEQASGESFWVGRESVPGD